MHVEILSLSTSKQCENSADWAFTSIGSKACGGPTGFVAYSLKLNTTEFPTKLKNTQIIRKNSIRNGVISTCDVFFQQV
jgi:hypothetical protein